jgi:hypothetical protein
MYSGYTDAYDLGFDGLVDSGTFLVDSTTAKTLAVGDFVTLVAANTCGFGSANATILGRVEAVENYSNDDTDGKVATVKRRCSFEDVALSATTTYHPTSYGDLIAVDGAGKIQKLQPLAVDTTNNQVTMQRANCFAIEVDTTNAVATIWLD